MEQTVGVVSLGCAKNLVDSELILGQLQAAGFTVTPRAEEAAVLIVNTCGFITPAKEESVNTILELARFKTRGCCRVLLVAGCLAQRYGRELLAEMPEIDGVLGTGAVPRVADAVWRALSGEKVTFLGAPGYDYDTGLPRLQATPGYTAYVKIAEGCSHRCSFCAIPAIRGPYRSRSMEAVEAEVAALAAGGVKEVILVAQDTTSYGRDLYGDYRLASLLRRLAAVPGVAWLRLLYCHPDGVTDELITAMAEEEKICSYLDLPLQHINRRILGAMGRRGDGRYIRRLIERLRNRIPGLTLRTSLIVGFPGETEAEFQELLDFMQEVRFERAGIFKFCPEEGTHAAVLPGQLPEELKEERYHRAMAGQQKISLEHNLSLIGRKVEVLVEGRRKDRYYGRTRGDAPEVDGRVVFTGPDRGMASGSLVTVRVHRAGEYDLIGELIP
ncbi:30S ribosomal protein S12 methylthiotransferase RimO [Desulfotomaculum copahuensis]|uniref:Ribosomal protein uS12 methylthiotransferase RimO n=1 Tax=Desulfotomaculum copahuensis TaxID=1838280 RepID=A0A1B7LJE7_9FIRM|nr:30S ribosomal protein S12 methylthiotransferase RimO [Desulfotomaculum copahuensis]OAT86689.1 ribosomal protein S12 methylthiotransferase RimO [Desulfotomaculum copahuensis]